MIILTSLPSTGTMASKIMLKVTKLSLRLADSVFFPMMWRVSSYFFSMSETSQSANSSTVYFKI